MLETLFTRCELRRYVEAPLLDERARYLAHCKGLGVPHKSLQLLATYQLIIMDYLYLSEGKAVTPDEVSAAADRWVATQMAKRPLKRPSASRGRFASFATRWLAFGGRLRLPPVAPHPYADTLADFAKFMTEEKLMAAETVRLRCRRAGDFLAQLQRLPVRLADVTASEIDRIVASKREDRGWARRTIQGYVATLHAFLSFAGQRGFCAPGLETQLIAPRVYKGENLPSGPSWKEVQKLCEKAETDRPVDIRDRAIILLFAVYGLRLSELHRLTLDDLDWEGEILRVRRSKQVERTQLYPLTQTAGDAVLRYVTEVRPRSGLRALFFQMKSPIQPLSLSAIKAMTRRREQALGMTLRHYGPHSLRHACACRLLAEGLSMKAIGDHLGHRCVGATEIYAKVDLKGLRTVGEFSLEGLL
ncbi:MAG: tyrosine-type recombinase/integrase [Acidobacteriota bacterium]